MIDRGGRQGEGSHPWPSPDGLGRNRTSARAATAPPAPRDPRRRGWRRPRPTAPWLRPRSKPPGADSLRACGNNVHHRQLRHRKHVHRLRHRLAYCPDLGHVPQTRSVEDVSARSLERLQPLDRVLQVWIPPDVVLRPRRQQERKDDSAVKTLLERRIAADEDVSSGFAQWA
jgi:hypothetical protein